MVGHGPIGPEVHPIEGATAPHPNPNPTRGSRLRLEQFGVETGWSSHVSWRFGIPRGPLWPGFSQGIPQLVAVMMARQAPRHQEARDLGVVREAGVRCSPMVTSRELLPWPGIPQAPLVMLGLMELLESRPVLAVWLPPCRVVAAAITAAVVAVAAVAAANAAVAVVAVVVAVVVAAVDAAAAGEAVVAATWGGGAAWRAAAVVAGLAAAPER